MTRESLDYALDDREIVENLAKAIIIRCLIGWAEAHPYS